ncbi:MAG TPA: FG-GAP-like repeat-containing protein [Opitutaceae bacterium]|nr:FG-GAP-like repeat-containing protein [Opitutaceae bacterium]
MSGFLSSFFASRFRPFGRRACVLAVGFVALQPLGYAEEMPDISSVALAAKSGPSGSTLFTTLPPERTGVRAFNAYDDPAMWWQRYREFTLGAIGTGVAVGDYDGDGRPDIFVVCKTGANHLFRNLGDFRFEDVTDRAGVGGPTATEGGASAWKQGAAFADVNNDGRLDLYVCRFDAPNLLYVNQGDGTFREEAAARGLALKDASSMAAFCDYDRDGWLDVYVQTNVLDTERRPNGQRDHLFRNNRDGTFSDVTKTAGLEGETQGHSATWWDFDEDGWPDVYVANDFKDPDQLYRNNRDGTFTNVLSYAVPHTPHSSMGADLGDVNNDGHLDLLVADMAATTRHKDHRGMAKLRAGLTENEQRPKAAPQYMRNALFLGTGAGRMLEAAFLAGLDATDWTWSVRLEDLDNDGRLDAYFTNGMVRELHGVDLLQRAMAFESGNERIKLMKASPPLAERNLVFRNLGDLRFENASAGWGLDHSGIGFGAAFADFDGDGDLDLVFVNYEGEPTVCRNDSASGNAVVIDLRGAASNRFGIGATLRAETRAGTQVRTLTLARGYLSTSEPAVHFGLGEATTIKSLRVEWPGGHIQTFTDLAANRRYLIREPAGPPGAMSPPPKSAPFFTEVSQKMQLNLLNRERPLNQLSREQSLPFRMNRPGPPAVFADLDGDGQDDLVVGGVAGEAGQLLSNLGDGQFLAYGSSIFSEAAAVADGPILAIDIDADGDLDLLVTKAGTAAAAGAAIYQPRVLLNDGRGRFAPAPPGAELIPPLPISVGGAAAADFERSGRLGVFLGGRVVPGEFPQPPRSVLLAVREGRLVDVTAELAPGLASRGMVTAALWSDVDADGWIDLLVAYDWGQVACYRNLGGKKFEDVSEKQGFSSAGSGWWRSLAAADFNGDGRPDFAVGNTGLNTRYRASVAEPAVLYANLALDGSAPQLVEAQAEKGKYYPLSSREPLVKSSPALARRFPTAESYARATLEEIFPAGALAAAAKLTATELRSGVFLSQRDGTYRFTPLPRLAQVAPIHGMVAADFDGDGRTDLMAVGNSYAPPAEPGRFDGGIGWLLRGDGRGGFTPVPAGESGFVVPGDGRSLAAADLNQDGWPDLLVTRNNDRALLFHGRGAAAGRSFGVALRGAAGNPAAIGARLALTLSDGSAQTLEIAAGSGYFGQSGATTFFGYSDAVLPARLKIRWPDGRETEQTFTAPPPKLLRISAP